MLLRGLTLLAANIIASGWCRRSVERKNLHARTSFLETQYRICLMDYVNELITS